MQEILTESGIPDGISVQKSAFRENLNGKCQNMAVQKRRKKRKYSQKPAFLRGRNPAGVQQRGKKQPEVSLLKRLCRASDQGIRGRQPIARWPK